jgi:hypothetical protein
MVKLLRRLGFARGALSCRSDRAEIAFFLVTALLVLAVLPVWLVVENWAVDFATRTSVDRAAHGRYVTAVLAENAPVGASTGEYSSVGKAQAQASWTAPDGAGRSGGVPVEPGMRAGQSVPVWTDEAGRFAPAPSLPDEIRIQGQVIALIAALVWLMVVAVAGRGARALLEVRRLRAWGREWERLEPFWRSLR